MAATPDQLLPTVAIDAISVAPTAPLVNTAHMNEPHAKASAPNATTQTPEYVSTLNTLRRSPVAQLKAIGAKHGISPAVAGVYITDDTFIQAIAEAELTEIGLKKLEL